jgi:CheY-like chemotaxis protein
MSKKLSNLWIIDDDPMSSFYIKRLAELGELAHIITIHNKAQGAIDYLMEHKKSDDHLPEVILLDIYMPVLDGWGFLERYNEIKGELSRKISIYIISSSNHPKDYSKAEEFADVQAYFEKPVTIDILKEMVSRFIEENHN